jgi:type I restriction enzyme S subunit
MAIEFGKDGPWELPQGWVWVRLEDVTREPKRLDPRSIFGESFRYIDLSAIENGGIREAKPIPTAQAPSRARQQVRSGDTILSCVRVYLQNNAIVPSELDGQIASTAFCVLRPSEVLEPRYLFWFVHSRKFMETLIPLQRGNSPPAVLDDTVRDQLIAVPPLFEQRRIVKRIDDLFSEIADGETALTRAHADLDTWRRALLKTAVTGELTREWRKNNRPVQTGQDVLDKTVSARSLHVGKGSRSRRPGAAEPLALELPELPDTWIWAQLAEIGEIVGGVTVDKNRKPTEPVDRPYLRVANVQRGFLDLREIKHINVERAVAEVLELKFGDVLLNEGGDRDKIGRGWVWEEQIDGCIHQNHVFRVRLYGDALNPFFISHFANEMGRAFFVTHGKQTTNLASISMSKISQLPVPVGPQVEIEEAMQTLNSLVAQTDDVEANLKDANVAGALRQAVLKAAFTGELVDQDPADEPAEVLLARLCPEELDVSKVQPAKRSRKAHAAQ